MEGNCLYFIDPVLFFRFLKRRCHGYQFWTKLANWPSFNMMAFRNGFEYRNVDLQILNGNIRTTFWTNLTNIGLVTPVITRVKTTFLDKMAKIGITRLS